MKEISLCVCRARYLNKELNPNRVESFYVRAKTTKRCIEILNVHGKCNTNYADLRNFGLLWGSRVKRPCFEGEGLWLTRDHFDKDLIPVWLSEEKT